MRALIVCVMLTLIGGCRALVFDGTAVANTCLTPLGLLSAPADVLKDSDLRLDLKYASPMPTDMSGSLVFVAFLEQEGKCTARVSDARAAAPHCRQPPHLSPSLAHGGVRQAANTTQTCAAQFQKART